MQYKTILYCINTTTQTNNQQSMENSLNLTASQPMTVKYVETARNGIQSHTLSRCAIGFVLKGRKYIYDGDKRQVVNRGDIFFLDMGHHYMEDIPENGQQFEQILFYYSPSDLQRVVMNLTMSCSMTVANSHTCENCNTHNHVVESGWSSARNFFIGINNNLHNDSRQQDLTGDILKLAELTYLIMSHEDCCLKNKLLNSIDISKGNFEQVIMDHIFKDVSIEELAEKSNRSLTSFKKEFKRHFRMPPHKWYIQQRLMRSRLLLISTSKSISEIGNECTFPNTSHFIKLFKKEYIFTPASYRHRFSQLKNEIQSIGIKEQEEVIAAL